MNTKAELIVLNHTKFGENTIILHTLSNEYGRRGFLVRAGAKSSMALFLPMNILEAEISENPKSQLWKASNFVCLSPLNGIRGDIRKNTMTVFMSEVLYRAILEDTNEGGLASWLKQEILTLDALKSDFSNFHLLFLLDLCSALGFSPSLPGLAPFAGTQLSNIEALLRNYYRDSQGFSSRDGNSQSASFQDRLSQSSPFQDRLSQSSRFRTGFPNLLSRMTIPKVPRSDSQKHSCSHSAAQIATKSQKPSSATFPTTPKPVSISDPLPSSAKSSGDYSLASYNQNCPAALPYCKAIVTEDSR